MNLNANTGLNILTRSLSYGMILSMVDILLGSSAAIPILYRIARTLTLLSTSFTITDVEQLTNKRQVVNLMEKVIGSISHKIDFLHTNLIVVVGHSMCSIVYYAII